MTRVPSRPLRLGDLQLSILKVLWERGEAAVGDVHDALDRSTPLAYTTVATMLRKMEARGLVEHREDGRRFVYRPLVREEVVSRGMAVDVLDRLFEGSLADMVSHLLEHRKVDDDELRRIERLIARRRRQP
jgi:predicted transcriptional regulator